MPLGKPSGARCVQRFDDSLNSAIHITFRTFAAFFIDAKAKRSVVESCTLLRRALLYIHAFLSHVFVMKMGEVSHRCTKVYVDEE